MAKWCDEGENLMLDVFFKDTNPPANVYMGIYRNSSEPAESDNLAALTEPSGNGYERKAIAINTGWTLTTNHVTAAKQTFTASGGDWGNCYGYFFATSADGSGKLLGVEHFSDGPYNVTDGDSVEVTPTITCG
jgi:hypothetical protein